MEVLRGGAGQPQPAGRNRQLLGHEMMKVGHEHQGTLFHAIRLDGTILSRDQF